MGEDEMAMEEGDILEAPREGEDGWTECLNVRTGKRGLVPTNRTMWEDISELDRENRPPPASSSSSSSSSCSSSQAPPFQVQPTTGNDKEILSALRSFPWEASETKQNVQNNNYNNNKSNNGKYYMNVSKKNGIRVDSSGNVRPSSSAPRGASQLQKWRRG